MSEKTEEPTAQRITKARADGDSGVSAFASQAVAFAVAVALLPSALGALSERAAAGVITATARAGEPGRLPSFDPGALAKDVLSLTLPVLAAVALTSAVVSAVQSGGALATKKLAPDLSRLDPFAGFGRLFSMDRVFVVVRALAASAFVGWFAWKALHDAAKDLGHTTARVPSAVFLAAHAALTLAKEAAMVGLVVAVIDVALTRRSWLRRLRMSKEEIKRERKDSEGDPAVRAARERARHDVMHAVIVAKVKEASVVIVNPTHLASALRYDEEAGDEAPVVVASGRGDLATRIIDAANAYGIPVVRDVPLARALIELEIGDAIPEALYEAVAEILREMSTEER